MVIMGFDPGNARCGWGFLEKTRGAVRHIACGCVETPNNIPEGERLACLEKELLRLIDEYGPQECAVESLFFFKNPKTVIQVAQARGVIIALAAKKGLPCYSYTPLQVKQAIACYGRAEKSQVLSMLTRALKLKEVPRPDDAADALAVAWCHSSLPEALKRKDIRTK